MKKSTMRVLSLVMAIMMIVGTLAVIPFSAYGNDVAVGGNDVAVAGDKCTHVGGRVVKTIAATCTELGYTVYDKCTICGEGYVSDIVSANGHDYQATDGEVADCATGKVGYTAGVRCTVCGDVLEGCKEVEPQHTIAYRIIDGEYTVVKNEDGSYQIKDIETTPDCTKGVTYMCYCSVCQKIISDTEEIIAANDAHALVAIINPDNPPSCEKNGELLVLCESEGRYYFEDCGYEGPKAVPVAALGHNYVRNGEEPWFDPFDEPHYYEICTRCGDKKEITQEQPPIDEEPGDHQWESRGFSFTVNGQYVYSIEFDDPRAFFDYYVKYCDVSPLFEVYVCTYSKDDFTCGEERFLRRVEKVQNHVYGEFAFNFKGDIVVHDAEKPEDSKAYTTVNVDYTATLNGKTEITYYCKGTEVPVLDEETGEPSIDEETGEPVVEIKDGKVKVAKTCAICAARAELLGEDYSPIQVELDDLQFHDHTPYWICQNEECLVLSDTETEQIPVMVNVTVPRKVPVMVPVKVLRTDFVYVEVGDGVFAKAFDPATGDPLVAPVQATDPETGALLYEQIQATDPQTGEPLVDEETGDPIMVDDLDNPIYVYDFVQATDPETGALLFDEETGDPIYEEEQLIIDGVPQYEMVQATDPETGEPLVDEQTGEPILVYAQAVNEETGELLFDIVYKTNPQTGDLLLDEEGKPIPETVQAEDEDGNPLFNEVPVEERPIVPCKVGNDSFGIELPEGYYHCKNCEHAHVEEVCFNAKGTAVYTSGTKIVVNGGELKDRELPEIIPVDNDEEMKNVALFVEIEVLDKVNQPDYRGIELCFDHDPLIVGAHELTAPIKYEGDCQHQSYTRVYCTRVGCDYEVIEYGDFGEHDFYWEVVQPSNCVDKGIESQFCRIEGCPYNKLTGSAKASRYLDINPEKHKGEFTYETIIEATCTKKGSQKVTCEACGESWEAEYGPISHSWENRPAKVATCFDAGNKAYRKCTICGTFDVDAAGNEMKGEVIPAFKHQYIEDGVVKSYLVNVEPEEADKNLVKTMTVTVNGANPKFQEMDYALRSRQFSGAEVVIDENNNYTYTLLVVEPTCAREGYVIGTYCTKCMEIYAAQMGRVFCAEGLYTGYILPKLDTHTYQHVVSTPMDSWQSLCGGGFDYEYDFYYCIVCGDVKDCEIEEDAGIAFFDMVTGRPHAPEYETISPEDSEDEDAEPTYKKNVYDVIEIADGIYVKATEENEVLYGNCTYARGTAFKCEFCGEFFDFTLTEAARGHYASDDSPIVMTCDGYDPARAFVKCYACGREIPEYDKETGIYYCSIDGSSIRKKVTDEALVWALGYFTIEHDMVYGIVENEDEDVCYGGAAAWSCVRCNATYINGAVEFAAEHEYVLRNGDSAPFVLANYDDYAFLDVVYPTLTADGEGTLKCINCLRETVVTIPAIEAEFTASYDNADGYALNHKGNKVAVVNALVGDEVTVTIKITAKNFTFSELKFDVRNSANRVELVNAKVVYPFGDFCPVKAYTNQDGDIVVRCEVENGTAVVSNADNEDFLKLTFKTGDLTDAQEVTTYKGTEPGNPGIRKIEVTRVDEELDIAEESKIQFNSAKNFGVLNVYNPNYIYSPINVLKAVFTDSDDDYYDFDGNGSIGIGDYYKFVDYYDSARTIADFCELVGYDVEAMLDGLDYAWALANKKTTTAANNIIVIAPVTVDQLKVEVRNAFATTKYSTAIIDAQVTIQQFAQNIIDAE